MSDTIYRVLTVYETDTGPAESGADRIAAKHDAITGALSRTASSLTGMFDRAATAAAGIVVALGSALAITGIAALVHGVTTLNAQAEEARTSIAGMFQAGGAVAAGAGGFNSALRMSDDIIQRMRVHANALPGEFRDLQNVFEGGLIPGLESGRTAAQIEGLSASFMAVSQTFRVESQAAGREFNMLLEGRAGSHVVMWSRLSGIIGKTAQDWNAMSRAQRFDALERALRGFGPMVDAYGHSWAAVSSTARDHVTQMLRIATTPLFDRVKADLALVNGWFERNQGRLETMAHTIGVRLADAFDVVVTRVSHLVEMVQHFSLHDVIAQVESVGQRMGGGMLAARAGLGLLSSPGALTGVGSMVGGGAMAGAGVLGAIALPLVVAIADGAVDVRHVARDLEHAVGPLGHSLSDLGNSMRPLLDLIGVGMVTALTAAVQAISDLVSPVARLGTGLLDIVNWISRQSFSTAGGHGGTASAPGVRSAEEQNRADAGGYDVSNEMFGHALSYVRSSMRMGSYLQDADRRNDEVASAILMNGAQLSVNEANMTARAEAMNDLRGMNTLGFRSAAHEVNPGRHRAVNTPQGHTTVHVRLETTINDASDPNRVVSSFRHILSDTVRHAVESAHQQVLR